MGDRQATVLSRRRIDDLFLKGRVAGKFDSTAAPGLDGRIGLAGLLILLAQQDVDLRKLRLGRHRLLLVKENGWTTPLNCFP